MTDKQKMLIFTSGPLIGLIIRTIGVKNIPMEVFAAGFILCGIGGLWSMLRHKTPVKIVNKLQIALMGGVTLSGLLVTLVAYKNNIMLFEKYHSIILDSLIAVGAATGIIFILVIIVSNIHKDEIINYENRKKHGNKKSGDTY
jgi:hypothetical protein